jgi:hypothetical protein
MTTIWMVSGLTLVVALGLTAFGWQNSAELGRMLAEVLDKMKTLVPAGTVGGV